MVSTWGKPQWLRAGVINSHIIRWVTPLRSSCQCHVQLAGLRTSPGHSVRSAAAPFSVPGQLTGCTKRQSSGQKTLQSQSPERWPISCSG